MILEQALELFLKDHRIRGSRPATVSWYGNCLGRLLREQLPQPVDCLTPALMLEVLSADVKPASRANYDRCLRAFCNWLLGVGLLEADPFRGRRRVRERSEQKDVLSLPEMEKLFRVAGEDSRFRLRHRAMLSLMLGSGLRVSDIDWEMHRLHVDGKTGWDWVPMNRATARAIRAYLTHERKGLAPQLLLYDGQPLTPMSVSHLVNRLARRAGITRPVGAHLLRHTFATHYLRNGGDALSLQRILRHSSPAMTQRYVHLVGSDMAGLLDRFSPLGR